MTVRELIQELQSFDGDKDVVVINTDKSYMRGLPPNLYDGVVNSDTQQADFDLSDSELESKLKDNSVSEAVVII